MQTIVDNIPAIDTLSIDRHVENRDQLLCKVASATTTVENSVRNWAKASLNAIAAGFSTLTAEQDAVVQKFPALTASGKVSSTPHNKFRSHWNRFCLAVDVLEGTSKTYQRPEAVAMVRAFMVDTSKQALSDLETSIKRDQSDANKAARAAVTPEEKAEEERAETVRSQTTVAGIVANDSAMILALSARLDAMEGADLVGISDALNILYTAIGAAAVKIEAATAAAELALAA